MNSWTYRAIGMALIFFLVVTGTFAHMGATGIVKERMDGMVAMKEAMATIGNMARGKAEVDFELAEEAAETMRVHGEKVPDLFPDTKESRQKVSEATPAVWEKPQEFAARNAAFLERVDRLQAVIAAEDEDMLSQAFATTGTACSACHEIFRQKK